MVKSLYTMMENGEHTSRSARFKEWHTLEDPDFTEDSGDAKGTQDGPGTPSIVLDWLRSEMEEQNNKAQLVDIVREQIEKGGDFDLESLPSQDKEKIDSSPYSVEQLVQLAEEQIARDERGRALASLSEYNTANVRSADSKLVNIAINKLCESRNQSREELREDATNFAYEIYYPSIEDQEKSKDYARSIAELISDDDMSICVGDDINRILENPDQLVFCLGNFRTLFDKRLDLDTSLEFGDSPCTENAGNYDSYMNKVKVSNKRFVELRDFLANNLDEHSEATDYSSLFILTSFGVAASRGFMRAYQYNYKKQHDDDRALKYDLNLANYTTIADDRKEHEEQLVEREASAFSEVFRHKLVKLVAERRGLRLDDEMFNNEHAHNRALTAAANKIFDGRPVSLEEALLIEQNGGFDVLCQEARKQNVESFNKYELIKIFNNKGNDLNALTSRELSAIKYMTAEEGYSNIYDFIDFEYKKRSTPNWQAVEIIFNIMRRSPVEKDIDYSKAVSSEDYEKIKELDLGELIQSAQEWAYIHYANSIIGRLSGFSRYSKYTGGRLELEGERYIVGKIGGGDYSEAESKIKDMVRSVYTPSKEEIVEDRENAARYVNEISDEMIKAIVDDLYQNRNIDNLIRSVANIAKSTLPLLKNRTDYKIYTDKLSTIEDGRNSDLGLCAHDHRAIFVFKSNIRKKYNDNYTFIKELISTTTHECFHAYQYVSKYNDTSEISIRRIINDNNYMESRASMSEYLQQLLEREANDYGEAVASRFMELMDKEKLGDVFE